MLVTNVYVECPVMVAVDILISFSLFRDFKNVVYKHFVRYKRDVYCFL